MQNPIELFKEWHEKAKETEPEHGTVMNLATVNRQNKPRSRNVLLKAFDERGFVFYTNLKSPKIDDISQNPYVALCFFWTSIDKQVRIEGKAERVSSEEADRYFASRIRLSQIGAWASKQSSQLKSMELLEKKLDEHERKFEGQEVPRPDFWSGYRVVPESMEFWSRGKYRLHKREYFSREKEEWKKELLYP